jgi:hypothetical protein
MMKAGKVAKAGRRGYLNMKPLHGIIQEITEMLGEGHPHVIFLNGAVACISATSPKSAMSDIRQAQKSAARAMFALREVLGPDHPNCLALQYNIALLLAAVDKYDQAYEDLDRASRSLRKTPDKSELFTMLFKKALEDLPAESEEAIPYMRTKMLVLTVDIGMCILVPPIEHDLLANFFEPHTEKAISGPPTSTFQTPYSDSTVLVESGRSNYSSSSSPIATRDQISAGMPQWYGYDIYGGSQR